MFSMVQEFSLQKLFPDQKQFDAVAFAAEAGVCAVAHGKTISWINLAAGKIIKTQRYGSKWLGKYGKGNKINDLTLSCCGKNGAFSNTKKNMIVFHYGNKNYLQTGAANLNFMPQLSRGGDACVWLQKIWNAPQKLMKVVDGKNGVLSFKESFKKKLLGFNVSANGRFCAATVKLYKHNNKVRNYLYFFDLQTDNNFIKYKLPHNVNVTATAFSQDDLHHLILSGHSTIYISQLENDKDLTGVSISKIDIISYKNRVGDKIKPCLAVNRNGSLFAVADGQENIYIYKVVNGQCIKFMHKKLKLTEFPHGGLKISNLTFMSDKHGLETLWFVVGGKIKSIAVPSRRPHMIADEMERINFMLHSKPFVVQFPNNKQVLGSKLFF